MQAAPDDQNSVEHSRGTAAGNTGPVANSDVTHQVQKDGAIYHTVLWVSNIESSRDLQHEIESLGLKVELYKKPGQAMKALNWYARSFGIPQHTMFLTDRSSIATVLITYLQNMGFTSLPLVLDAGMEVKADSLRRCFRTDFSRVTVVAGWDSVLEHLSKIVGQAQAGSSIEDSDSKNTSCNHYEITPQDFEEQHDVHVQDSSKKLLAISNIEASVQVDSSCRLSKAPWAELARMPKYQNMLQCMSSSFPPPYHEEIDLDDTIYSPQMMVCMWALIRTKIHPAVEGLGTISGSAANDLFKAAETPQMKAQREQMEMMKKMKRAARKVAKKASKAA